MVGGGYPCPFCCRRLKNQSGVSFHLRISHAIYPTIDDLRAASNARQRRWWRRNRSLSSSKRDGDVDIPRNASSPAMTISSPTRNPPSLPYGTGEARQGVDRTPRLGVINRRGGNRRGSGAVSGSPRDGGESKRAPPSRNPTPLDEGALR